MGNAIIFHGGYSTPTMYWYPSIKEFLEKRGVSVWISQLPDSNNATIDIWLSYALKHGTYHEDTILIGHSWGGVIALCVLEHLEKPINKAIIIAGYTKPRKFMRNKEERMLPKKFNWEKIKRNVRDLIFINSSNDPWDCDDEQGLYMWKHLGGTLILRENEGHMGSEKAGQSYTRFYLLEKLLELDYSRQSLDGSDKK